MASRLNPTFLRQSSLPQQRTDYWLAGWSGWLAGQAGCLAGWLVWMAGWSPRGPLFDFCLRVRIKKKWHSYAYIRYKRPVNARTLKNNKNLTPPIYTHTVEIQLGQENHGLEPNIDFVVWYWMLIKT